MATAGSFGQDTKTDAPKPMTPEMQEMMKKWEEVMTPGPMHKVLARMEGIWNMESRMWMGGPDAPPTVTRGTAVMNMVLGGRFLRQDITSEMMGRPMEGVGFTGYDNFNKKFIGSWVDNFSTAMVTMEGFISQDGNILTMYGTMDEPMTGEHDKHVKYVTRFIEHDRHAFEIHDLSIGEPHTKVVEIVYTRKK
jgi:hypothetical protein